MWDGQRPVRVGAHGRALDHHAGVLVRVLLEVDLQLLGDVERHRHGGVAAEPVVGQLLADDVGVGGVARLAELDRQAPQHLVLPRPGAARRARCGRCRPRRPPGCRPRPCRSGRGFGPAAPAPARCGPGWPRPGPGTCPTPRPAGRRGGRTGRRTGRRRYHRHEATARRRGTWPRPSPGGGHVRSVEGLACGRSSLIAAPPRARSASGGPCTHHSARSAGIDQHRRHQPEGEGHRGTSPNG